jgi:hypothetical protein
MVISLWKDDNMKALLFTPDRNHKNHDFTGAFLPEAYAFAKAHLVDHPVIKVNIAKPREQQRDQTIAALAARKDLEAVAFFCHGQRGKIQLGFDLATAYQLSDAISKAGSKTCKVILYCCSTGSSTAPGGEGGFADKLADHLSGIPVYAHTTAGHCCKNPYVRVFDGTGTGGRWVVEPGTDGWVKWTKALRTDYRFWFPFKGQAAYLQPPPA